MSKYCLIDQRRRVLISYFALLGISCLPLGCGYSKPFLHGEVAYQSLSEQQRSGFPLVVAILPPEDKRGDTSYDNTIYGAIPLVPFGSAADDRIENGPWYKGSLRQLVIGNIMEYKVPETITHLYSEPLGPTKNQYGYPKGFQPILFLQHGLLEELKQANLFEAVGPVDTEQQAAGADLVLRAQLLSTQFTHTYITYGTSAITYQLTAIIPFLPMCSVSQELEIKFELARPGEAKPVWTGVLSESLSGKNNFWGRSGIASQYVSGDLNGCGLVSAAHQGQLLNEVLASGMAEVTSSLVNFLSEQPRNFWESMGIASGK